jgi:hypothetical protein
MNISPERSFCQDRVKNGLTAVLAFGYIRPSAEKAAMARSGAAGHRGTEETEIPNEVQRQPRLT